jgi:plastocyanin
MQRLLLVLAFLLMAAGALDAAEQAGVTVAIDNFSFSPEPITVPAGTKVTWVNHDDIPHTITDASEPRAYKSAALDTDEAYAFVFRTPGTYRYFCSLHPHMQGTVVVR